MIFILFKFITRHFALTLLVTASWSHSLAAPSACNASMTQQISAMLTQQVQQFLGRPRATAELGGGVFVTEIFAPQQKIVDPNTGETIQVPMTWTVTPFSQTIHGLSYNYIDIGIHYFPQRTLPLLSEKTSFQLGNSSDIFPMLPELPQALGAIYTALLQNGYHNITSPSFQEFTDPNNFQPHLVYLQSLLNVQSGLLANTHSLGFQGTWLTKHNGGSSETGPQAPMVEAMPYNEDSSQESIPLGSNMMMNSSESLLTLNGFRLKPHNVNLKPPLPGALLFSRKTTSAYLRIDLQNFFEPNVNGVTTAMEDFVKSLSQGQ